MTVIGIIGTGSLGTHLVRMLLSHSRKSPVKHRPRIDVIGSVRNYERRNYLECTFGSSMQLYDNRLVARLSDIILISVKPEQVKEVCEDIKNTLTLYPRKIIISTAAAVPLNKLLGWLPTDSTVIRCTSNIPCSLGSGLVTYYSNASNAREIMDTVFYPNKILEVKSDKSIDIATVITGCGPAFIAWYIDCLKDIGEEQFCTNGLKIMLSQTIIGTGEMLAIQDPDNLIRAAAFPNGATDTALKELTQNGAKAKVQGAFMSAYNHINKMSEEL